MTFLVSMRFSSNATLPIASIFNRISYIVVSLVINPVCCSRILCVSITPAVLHSFHSLIYSCVGLADGLRMIACVACGIVRSRLGSRVGSRRALGGYTGEEVPSRDEVFLPSSSVPCLYLYYECVCMCECLSMCVYNNSKCIYDL